MTIKAIVIVEPELAGLDLVATTRERRASAALATNPNRGKRHVSYAHAPRTSAADLTSAVKTRKRRPLKRVQAQRRAFEEARIARILEWYARGGD